MGYKQKIDPGLEVLVIGAVGNKTKTNGSPTRILGYHHGKEIFEIENTSWHGGDVVFMDHKNLIFSDSSNQLNICDAKTLELKFVGPNTNDIFSKILANDRYIFSVTGTGSESYEGTIVRDINTFERVNQLAGGYDACFNGDYFIVIPQEEICVYDAKTLREISRLNTSTIGSSLNFNQRGMNRDVASSNDWVAVTNSRGYVDFFKLPNLEHFKTVYDSKLKASKEQHSTTPYALISNSKIIGLGLDLNGIDLYNAQNFDEASRLDFKPYSRTNVFYSSGNRLFVEQRSRLNPVNGLQNDSSIGVYDLESLSEIERITLPDDVHIKSLYLREGTK